MSDDVRTTCLKADLAKLRAGEKLTAAQAEEIFDAVARGGVDSLQISSLLTLLAVRGPTIDELVGVAKVMRRHAVPIAAPAAVIDTCGTGGVGSKLFNISTTAAIVAAACGVPVVKHGNRAITSVSGSGNVLRCLGVNIDAPPAVQEKCLRETNICFAFAVHHHPAMRHVAPVRQALGFSTIFNLMGPLTNPAGAKRQLVGVATKALAEQMLQVLIRLGAQRLMLVSGEDEKGGRLCELSIAGATDVMIADDGELKSFRMMPEDVGLTVQGTAGLEVTSAEGSAEIVRSVLGGAPGAARDIVLYNAGAALWVGGVVENFVQGVQKAGEAIDNGHAAGTLSALAALGRGG